MDRKFLKGGNKKYTKNEKKKFQEKLKNKERRENQREKNKIVSFKNKKSLDEK